MLHLNQFSRENAHFFYKKRIISVICGAKIWNQMVGFTNSKESFLRKFLELPNGIPSEDTINRVFSSIDSSQFETCFYRLG
jgi:hypothetical protein